MLPAGEMDAGGGKPSSFDRTHQFSWTLRVTSTLTVPRPYAAINAWQAGLGGSGVAACKYIPFSIGARACPGRQLAEAEMETATRTLLSRCRWRRMAAVDLREEYSLTLTPKTAQTLRFERL